MEVSKKRERIQKIVQEVARCTKCPLYKQAHSPVPGQGNLDAKVMFIGEGPGYHEDQRGIPFCGAAGRLLERLLRSIGLVREEVWIGNVVKHRPPGNRDPQPDEIEACRPFLDEQIAVIDPKIIVTLGRFSMRKFLPEEYISRVHGQARYVRFAGKKRIVIPMYHPAAALRNGQVMQAAVEDFKKIAMFLDGEQAIPEMDKAAEPKEENRQQQLSLIE